MMTASFSSDSWMTFSLFRKRREKYFTQISARSNTLAAIKIQVGMDQTVRTGSKTMRIKSYHQVISIKAPLLSRTSLGWFFLYFFTWGASRLS